MQIALVTEELATFGRSGGIGAAIFELAVSLCDHGHDVDVYYYPLEAINQEREQYIKNAFREYGVQIYIVNDVQNVFDQSSAQARSYVVYERLRASGRTYQFVHFHDYKGMGFFSTSAKQQGVAFAQTTLVVQLHGPTRWTIHANRSLFTHQDQLLIDFMEREAIRLADQIVSPSDYLIDWLKENGFSLPPDERVHTIKNVFSHCLRLCGTGKRPAPDRTQIRELIFFGRHEPRKGVVAFCDALDRICDELTDRNVAVCFVGGFGEIGGQPSGVYLSERAKAWTFPIAFRAGFDRTDALSFLRARQDAVVVIPSYAENSPYTVVEALASGRPVLTSLAGGAKELIDPEFHAEALVAIEPGNMAERLLALVEHGAPRMRFAEEPDAVIEQWLRFHSTREPRPAAAQPVQPLPKVVVGITHFERPRKVVGAIMSALRQTYQNIEVVVVDDGSQRPETLTALKQIESMLAQANGRLLRRENGYLGAARNTVARETRSDFLLFLDDDDLLLPEAVERLVTAARHSGADIVNCFNVFMQVADRADHELTPETHERKVAYIPVGGPLSLAHLSNNFGGATALIKRDFFDRVGGYTELKGVGYEDYEFFVRAVQAGGDLRILPEPLYLYEVGRPSMVSSTPRLTNKRRVVEALDLARHPAAWRDAVEVAAARHTLDEQESFSRWSLSASPHRELLEAVLETRGSPSAHVDALSDYASAIGADATARAWKKALDRPDAPTHVQRFQALTGVRRSVGAARPDKIAEEAALAADLASLIKVGRHDEAVTRLCGELETHGEANRTLVEFAYQLVGYPDLEAGAARHLVDRLWDASVELGGLRHLQGVVAALSVIAGFHEDAKSLLVEIEAAEAVQYVGRYADIQEFYKETAQESALKHFTDHGMQEARVGFVVLARIAREFSRRLGYKIELNTLMLYFDDSSSEERVSLKTRYDSKHGTNSSALTKRTTS